MKVEFGCSVSMWRFFGCSVSMCRIFGCSVSIWRILGCSVSMCRIFGCSVSIWRFFPELPRRTNSQSISEKNASERSADGIFSELLRNRQKIAQKAQRMDFSPELHQNVSKFCQNCSLINKNGRQSSADGFSLDCIKFSQNSARIA